MQKQRTIRVNDSGFNFSRFSISKDFVMFDCNSCIVFVEFGRWVIIGMALAAITFTVLAAVGAFISYKRLCNKKEGIYTYNSFHNLRISLKPLNVD